MGYVIIPKPHFPMHEGINCHCGHFDWLLFTVFAGHDGVICICMCITWSRAFVASSLFIAVADICVICHVMRHLAWRYKLSFWFYRSPLWSHCRQSDRSVAVTDLWWRSTMIALHFIQVNNRAGDSEFAIVFGYFSHIKKIARPNYDTNSWQDVFSVDTNSLIWDISRDDQARIATCSLLTATDRQTDLKKLMRIIVYCRLK